MNDTPQTPNRFARRVSLAALIPLFTAACLTAAPAQPIPVPKPPPKNRAADPQARTAPPAGNSSMAAIPTPVIPDPRNRQPTGTAVTFDAAQRAEAGRVSSYLSSVQTLVGNFVQVAPDGSKTTGELYIQKPGKVRFEYDDPSPIAVVSDGTSLVVRDRKLATQDVYPLSQTPLRYLLSDRIDLLKDTNVIDVSADDTYISVTIEEKHAVIGTSRLMLMIGTKDGKLKQWTVTDPQGYDTTVAVYNLDTTKKPDPSMFKIDFTNYAVPPY